MGDNVTTQNETSHVVDCIDQFCSIQLDDNFLQRYRVNVPDGSHIASCDDDDGNCTISFEIVYEGEAWVSVGFSEDGNMVGSNAVIGIPDQGIPYQQTPLLYTLGGKNLSLVQPFPEAQQTLTNASIEAVDGKTLMNFTKNMNGNDGHINLTTGDNHFLWAYGSSPELGYHAARGSYVMNPTIPVPVIIDESPFKSKWIAHGWLGFIAFGVLIPFAIQAAFMRDRFKQGLWMKIHQLLNGIAYLFSLATIGIAIWYVYKEESPHFNGPHKRMGLAIVIMATVQVFGGMIRPPKPNTLNSERAKKPVRRVVWETAHRMLGLVLVACSIWQMQSGLLLYDKKFGLARKRAILFFFWVWIAFICIMLFRGAINRWKIRSAAGRTPSWWNNEESDVHTSLL